MAALATVLVCCAVIALVLLVLALTGRGR